MMFRLRSGKPVGEIYSRHDAKLDSSMFLDVPWVQGVVPEARSDNDRMALHLQNAGFDKVKDLDFLNKRAALISLSREHFPIC